MTFTKESEFEEALILALSKKGWENEVIKNPTEEDLLNNWANILFDNNRGIDRLNDTPLTHGEMQQILEQITELRTPLKLNGFINGKTVAIKRDNPEDKLHFGKEVSLKIYDRHEIAAGQSRYQIVQQPKFPTKSKILNDRRGDILLLINGMPLIHIELKRSGVSVSQAYHQIENYSRSGIFSGLFSLVQVFVAMEPKETVYFANPGPDGKFNKDFYFHWADFNNEPINDWGNIASSLLSIPMAHQLIGFYTVPDNNDGVLKVMRSYQYYAANAISDKVAKTDWKSKHALGGYIWHTTGSGKTMTSFKSAQLIANSKDADKVIFLMDRIELGTQSLKEYRGFSDENEDVQATENTGVLVTKLKSTDPINTLIVTSIQKMSNIKDEDGGLNARDIEIMNGKRTVFIVDEAHRSTFGDMLIDIKNTFSSAIFFGFTGTPILDENQKKMNTTSTVFGDELHRYSIADGIRDKNVLGFDPYKILTYKDRDLRREIALEKARAVDEAEALSDPAKREIFNRYMNDVRMAGYYEPSGNYVRGIEDFVPKSQYEIDTHQEKVVEDIIENWIVLSQNNKFHSIFATSSINEAIDYYRLIKRLNPELKITALFDSTIENIGNAAYKEDGLVEILEDYNHRYEQDYTLATHSKFKKDIAARLAHKEPYLRIETTQEKQIDLLIVVDQMLTGFDSKWINTLYLDKVIKYENIIQAFSRTNRLFGPDKPFGTIRYYRFPHTMEQHINRAIELYSGDKPVDLFVDRLEQNLNSLNFVFNEISQLFISAGVQNFERLPESIPERGRFASLFKDLNNFLEAAKIQGFNWSQLKYLFSKGKKKSVVEMNFNENTYLILALRYRELFSGDGGGIGTTEVPFEIEGHLTEIDTDKIDADYMNSRFDKYLKELKGDDIDSEQLQHTLDELHKSFASLTQEEQKYANIFIHDIQSGIISIQSGKTFREYITEYLFNAKNDQIFRISEILDLDESKLRNMMDSNITEKNINEYGRFDDLKSTVDKDKAKEYFEKIEGKSIPPFRVNIKIEDLLQEFIISGGFEI
ncbi:DEAD/DEAH box helicase [Flavobacterium sp. 316]|uniref:type I restriction endonuclease subunit R n=1 Tax=Flavobacterium sp. 316 TaxID=1603293 RepID=UPI0005EA03AA|nr:HsdR family type I site-specific deoxyribonuclease [Flavobacterium sp. 316]KIX20723.1 DEAD/DEAH box helicase [Flavobacterium sp. 316]